MSLGQFSVRRPVTTAMAYLCLAGFGAYALWNLPVNRLPEVELPVIAVVTTYTGASPEDIETLVTEPIERAVASVGGIESVRSTSRQSTSVVIVSFTWGTDMEAAEVEVRKNLELFAGDFLPDEAARPLTFAFDPSLAPVMFLTVEGPLDGYRLRQIATERVQPYLGRVEGVAAAEVLGGLDREIQVRLEPHRLLAYGFSPTHVVDALRSANIVSPSGAVDDGTQRLNIQPTGLFRTVDEMREVVVGERGGRLVRMHEIAEIVDTFEDEDHVVTVGGERAVVVAVRKQSDANTVEVARNVNASLGSINERLPSEVTLDPLFDSSRSIVRAIGNLGQTGVQAFLLTGLVLLLFLRNWRSSVVAVIAVPTSILVSFTAMALLGVTLNLISMAGLALAIGMVVDNGIVVLEAAFQYLEKGLKPVHAAVRGAREMSLPLTASTLTTVVVFVPILLVEGIAGELFRDLVLTICVTLLCSLLVATTLVPLMTARWVGRVDNSRAANTLRRWTVFLDRVPDHYRRALAWALARKGRVLGVALGVFVASVAAVPILGQDFLPKADTSEIRIEVVGAPGASIDDMRRLFGTVELAVQGVVPEAEVISSDYGQPEGFGAIFGATANKGTVRIALPPPFERDRTQQEIEGEITKELRNIPGLDFEMASFSLGGDGGDVEVKLFGDELDELRAFGRLLREELGELEGVQETRFSMERGAPELQVEYRRERLREVGLAPATVDAAVATYFQGTTATVYREGGDEFLVQVRAAREVRRSVESLRYLPIALPSGATVPLGSIAAVGDRLGPVDVEHENQERRATVGVVASGMDLGGLTRRVESKIAEIGVPEGVRVETGGTAEDLRDAFFKLAMALLAALVLVYMVLASQFESLLEPFVIMFTVPLGAAGVVAALLLTGTTLQVTALVGMILLGGVVVNNGIVLIDVIKRRRAEGVALDDAALEAGRTRIRPILITSLTTILGMIPLSLGYGDGAETWAPMARAVVGGMVVSTGLTLFVIPVLYVLLAGWVDRRRQGRARAVGRLSEPPLTVKGPPKAARTFVASATPGEELPTA